MSSPSIKTVCPVCGYEFVGIPMNVPEMLCGTRELFAYLTCDECGLVWLKNPPVDIKKYYKDYYSLSPVNPHENSGFIKKVFHMIKTEGVLGFFSAIYRRVIVRPYRDRFLRKAACNSEGPIKWEASYERGVSLNACALFGLGLNLRTRILDYGSGNGGFVEELHRAGFKNSCGIDPFIDGDAVTRSGGKVFSGTLAERGKEIGSFDLVTLNHSFEHVPDPMETALLLSEHVAPAGMLILRFPNINSIHFRQYRELWWGLHAPRHYFFHTKKSLEKMFLPLGFKFECVKCDSCYDHYLYSQEYYLGISDGSEYSCRRDGKGVFLETELDFWKKKAKLLNRALVGDWIVYYLRKTR